MTYLLDTNTCIEFLRANKGSPVPAKMASIDSAQIAVCSVVVGELLFGAFRSNDPVKMLAQVQTFLAGFVSLPFDDTAAREYAIVRADLVAKGTPIGANDLLIAAIALANHLVLVTHNTRDFGRITGLKLDDWQI